MSNERAGDILIERFEVIACAKCSQPIDTSSEAPFTNVNCPSCGAEMRVPARFANFILLDQLGMGGMGAVYKAYDETLGRTVALKVMLQSIGQDRAFVEQFLQEARALAAINHPHIVQIYNYGEENGQPYIVMELVDGERLDHLQEIKKTQDEVFVLQTALQIISGLQAANAAGMTHGDIKPANILFDRAGSAKVADFGLARFKGEKPQPGEVWGTPYYVAPEVVRGQSPNAGSDIYSLGGTLYHILTGEPPFNCETVTDTVLLRFKEPAPDPREFKSRITPKTASILLRTLEMDPFARYPTYESLAKDISNALSPLTEARSGKKKPPEKKSAAPLILSLAALALIGGGLYFGMGIYKDKKAQKQKDEQRAVDIAEGRLILRMIDGKLKYVPSHASESPDAGQGEAPTLAATEWTIPASVDTAISQDEDSNDFKERTFLLLRAGDGPLEKASKIYLRFPINAVDREALDTATLQITAGRQGRKKTKSNSYELRAWALKKKAAGWDDTLTWKSAPGNDPKSAGEMLKADAVLLSTFDMPANPETGDRIVIPLKALVPFLQEYSEEELTLVLTADTETDQKNGWRISATEDDRFTPPTLLLKAK
jgi:serine/threonine protein kinase